MGRGHDDHPLQDFLMTQIDALPSAAHPLTGRREQYATRAVFLVAGLAMASWAPLVPFAKERVGVEPGGFGLLLLCLGLGSITAMPLTGILANRFGCRAVIVVAALVIAAVVPFLAIAETPVTLALALAIFGASVGTVDVAMNVQAVMVEKDSGRSMMSGFHGLFSLGGIVGAGGVSFLLGLGLPPLGATLIISGTLILLLVLSFSGLLPYGNREQGQSPLFVMPKGIVVVIGFLCFALFLAEGAILDWSALFLISAHGASEASAGLGYAMFAVTMTVGRLTGDRVVKALGGPRVVAAGGLMSAAGFLLAVIAPSQAVALVGFALVGLGAANIVPVFFTAAGRQTFMPASLAVAAITTMGYAGILLGPAVIGFVAQFASLAAAMAILAVMMLAVAIVGNSVARKV